jgi:hypothetical protein
LEEALRKGNTPSQKPLRYYRCLLVGIRRFPISYICKIRTIRAVFGVLAGKFFEIFSRDAEFPLS